MPRSSVSRRKDAERNRQAILAAARELLAASGDVPMYEIGRHAGVGQATLYRHFASRESLVMTIFSEQIEELEHLASERGEAPDAFLTLIQTVVRAQAQFYGLVECFDSPGGDALRRRLESALAVPLAAAKEGGALRDDVELSEVHLILAMVDGVLRHERDPAARERASERALSLVLEGVRTPGK